MITDIENAIVSRLKSGLGRMVKVVGSYSGELDSDKWARAIGFMPAVWVFYGGAKISTKNLAHGRYEQVATFAVMCATCSLRSEQAGRQGGVNLREVGSNTLITAVLRLLSGQRLDGRLNSFGLVPKNVRTILKSTVISNNALSVVSIEFSAGWSFAALPDGQFPQVTTDTQNPDYIFTQYGAEQSAQDADLNTVAAIILDPTTGAQIGTSLNVKDPNHESESS